MNDKKQIFKFSVIDNKTGEYPDLYNIALKEDWAKGLMYCDMEGFSINEDGQLILSDECGKFVYCPSDRFTVVFEDSVVLSMEEAERFRGQTFNIKKVKAQARKEMAEEILDLIAKIMKEEYGDEPPCNFNCNDEYMFDNCDEFCYEYCNKPDNEKNYERCWIEFFKSKMKKYGVEVE